MVIEKELSIGELASIVNKLEEAQLEEEFNPSLDGNIKTLVENLNKYTYKLMAYLDDIRGCLRGVAEFYRIHNKLPPEFSSLYQI